MDLSSYDEFVKKYIDIYHEKGTKEAHSMLDNYFKTFVYFKKCEFERKIKELDESKLSDYQKIENTFPLNLKIDNDDSISKRLRILSIKKVNKQFKKINEEIDIEHKEEINNLMIQHFNAKQNLNLYIDEYEQSIKKKKDKSLQFVPALVAINKKKKSNISEIYNTSGLKRKPNDIKSKRILTVIKKTD